MNKILVMGAHFDDIEIGVGGTVLHHVKNGDDVYFCIIHSDEFRTGAVDIRLEEQMKALTYLGVPKTNLICFESGDTDETIITELDSIKPDIIYTAHEDDTHQDHRRCSRLGQSIGRKPTISTLFYAGASARNFQPNIFIRVDVRKKKNLLAIYKSQIEVNAVNIDRITKREYYWGTMISSNETCYAEGFVVHKMEIKI